MKELSILMKTPRRTDLGIQEEKRLTVQLLTQWFSKFDPVTSVGPKTLAGVGQVNNILMVYYLPFHSHQLAIDSGVDQGYMIYNIESVNA